VQPFLAHPNLILQRLEQRDVATWGGGAYSTVRNDLAAGDAALTERDYQAALARFDAAAGGLDALEKRLPEVLRERLAQAQAAFDAGRATDAQEKYSAALQLALDRVFEGRWKKGGIPELWDGRTSVRIAEVLERLLCV
jgi:hypothetical protein